ncbi:HAD-IA family hydrolase [Moraxella nasibovis]|uniref:HAD family hydrolase n=1 Tax=Moraxella nasibovis TaxID=2904120 RepID=UPI00240ED50F|nr:HAD-IA family hydrolase [Moraxella nasibovis]WFF38572.1 HAD-IA family hydrolase [Moraxella nasibovis]
MSKLDAVLFDLDGTLIDTAPDFIRIIGVMCAKHNHPTPSDADIREQVSAGARAMVRLMFGDELAEVADTDDKLLAYRQEFLDLYEQDICVDSQLFDGLDDLLKNLENQGVPWGIVTNKPRYLAENLLNKLNLTDRCRVLVCPDDVANTKPDPEPIFLAVQRLNALGVSVRAENCIYVGDHIRDIQAGNAAQMTTVIAKFGYLSRADHANLHEWGADVVLDTPDELARWVLAKLENKA